MNTLQFHAADWRFATSHLTRTERDIYFSLLLDYYDREGPLPACDPGKLARRVQATTEEDLQALEIVLEEFFILEGDVYRHSRCDEEIEKFHRLVEKRSEAGKASARARRKMNKRSTPVQQVPDTCATSEEQPKTQDPRPKTHNPRPRERQFGA